jgi:hypothetical protein
MYAVHIATMRACYIAYPVKFIRQGTKFAAECLFPASCFLIGRNRFQISLSVKWIRNFGSNAEVEQFTRLHL